MSLTSAIGVDAVLCKPDGTTEMVRAIDTVLAGNSPPIFAEVYPSEAFRLAARCQGPLC